MSRGIPEELFKDTLPLLRQFCIGDYGIAIGGSYAKGLQDEQSDIDIYLFADQVLPCVQRNRLLEQNPTLFTQIQSWGNDADFTEGGTDFWYAAYKVECWLRNTRRIEDVLQACRLGQINRTCVGWTVMGFYNYVALSDVHVMHIQEDPQGILNRWKAQVSEYPAALQDAIIKRFLAEAQFWPNNFHYRTAIEREDILYTSGIVQQVVYALIQIIFALNRVYFPGEKKVYAALAHLALQPPEFGQRIRELVYPDNTDCNTYLRMQQTRLAQLVNEVKNLVSKEYKKA